MLQAELFRPARGEAEREMRELLAKCGLRLDFFPEETVLLYDGERAVATASRDKNVLRYIAVEPEFEGGGACASMVSRLCASAVESGINDLFVLTKPGNGRLFESLGFYAVAGIDSVLMLENRKGGIEAFLSQIERGGGTNGTIVMNADPFTRGHLFLCEQAAARCDMLYVFILAEERSRFSAHDRLYMAREGLKHIPNARVYSGGGYMISAATFPMYFIKDENEAARAQMELDAELFTNRIAPPLGISKRFVGTEPFCPLTRRYNEILKEKLPQSGIELTEIPRKDGVSASKVRQSLNAGDMDAVRALTPESSYEYILRHIG